MIADKLELELDELLHEYEAIDGQAVALPPREVEQKRRRITGKMRILLEQINGTDSPASA